MKKSIILLAHIEVVLEINKVKVALLLYAIQIRPYLMFWIKTGTFHLKKIGTLFNKIHGREPKNNQNCRRDEIHTVETRKTSQSSLGYR